MSIVNSKVKIHHADDKKNIGVIAYCTYTDGITVRVTPVNGDPLCSIVLKYNDVAILTDNECCCFDENSKQINQCNECPR